MSSGAAEELVNVSSSAGVSDVSLMLPRLDPTRSNYTDWVIEHRVFSDLCQQAGAEAQISSCQWIPQYVNISAEAASLGSLSPGQYEVRLHAEVRTASSPSGRRRRRNTQSTLSSPYTAPIVVNVPVSGRCSHRVIERGIIATADLLKNAVTLILLLMLAKAYTLHQVLLYTLLT